MKWLKIRYKASSWNRVWCRFFCA